MNVTEAARAVAMLATSYPSATFPEESAAAYEGFLADLEYPDVVQAISSLVLTDKFFPSVAAIRTEVFRARELARKRQPARLLPLPPTTGPRPEAWGLLLSKMQADSDRYRAIAEPWFKARGKPYPGDPAKPLIDLCQGGAHGADVRQGFRREVLNDYEERERYP